MKRQDKGRLIFRVIILNLEDINAFSNTKILINIIFIFPTVNSLSSCMAYHLLQFYLPCSWYGGMLVIYMGSHILGLPQWLSGKESACNTGDADSVLQLGRSPVNGNPFQCSCLKNPMCRWAWRLQSSGLQRVGHNWAWVQGIFYLVPSCLHLLKCIICSLILSYYTHQGSPFCFSSLSIL